MSSGNQQGSSTTSEPWANVKDPMINTINQAASFYGTPYQGYDGQRVADTSDGTNAYYNLAYQRAANGAPDLNAARGAAQAISSGQYLNTNPWLSDRYTNAVISDNANNMAKAMATGTAAQTDANFARQGAYGGSAWAQNQQANAANLATQVGQMANQYNLARANAGAQDYQSGISNMLQAGQLAGSLSQDDWTAANALKGVGDSQNAYQQKLLDSAYGDWSAEMQYPEYALKSMGNMLAQFSGYGTQSTTNPYAATSPWTTAIGGTTALAGLLSAMK